MPKHTERLNALKCHRKVEEVCQQFSCVVIKLNAVFSQALKVDESKVDGRCKSFEFFHHSLR